MSILKKNTLLGYELTPRQNAIVNYLVPSISACILYMLLIASDVAVIFSHFKNGDPIWASLTLYVMYLPVLGSYIIIVSNWELWPEFEGCGRKNFLWFWTKTIEHSFFPFWTMWRFAERLFWSIEAVRAKNDESIQKAIDLINAPRSIELYIFLQSYLHALPQILLQLYILMRHNADINRQTEKAQFLSLVFNLAKLSMTTTYYQRFKSQKLTGKSYPWYKYYKSLHPPETVDNVELRRSVVSQSRSVIENKRDTIGLEDKYDLEPKTVSARRRSSDIYLEPTTSDNTHRQVLLETDFDETCHTKLIPILEKTDGLMRYNDAVDEYPHDNIMERSEPDFNISRVIYVKGLEDDDLAGKLVAFFWWFTFLLARVLALSVFAYFHSSRTLWLIFSHVNIVLAFLLYDVKTDQIKRSKVIFFTFIAFVYIFCIIEFKIKFKKAHFIYYGFFALVFAENFVMCTVWFTSDIESIENDFWFRYIFYIVMACSITSFSSMVFYLMINKPPKVVVKALEDRKF